MTWAARITGLTSGTEYQVRVRKTNAAGNGPWSDIEDAAAVRSSATTIDPPFGARVTPGNAKATFTWSAPAHKGGQTITGYRIEVREADETSTFSKTVNVSGATATSGEVTGLTNGTEYEGLVRALDGVGGSGNPTVWQSFTPKASTRQVSFAQSSYSVAEGASVTLTVNVSPALTTASSVNVTTGTSGTTAANPDCSVSGLTGRSLTLPANATSATYTVAAVSDSNTEDPEKIEYVLEAVNNADYVVSGSSDSAVVTISAAQQTKSTVATLSGLTASTSTSATGTFTALTLSPSTFAATTTSYTATVANTVTHVMLTPSVSDSGATVKVGVGTILTAVSSGSASGAIALSVGANAIKAVVTAEDGTTTQTYTVTVTRRQPPTMEFELNAMLVVESDTDPEAVKLLLGEALAVQATVDFRVRASGTTALPADYTLSTTTLTFAAGDTEKTFPVLATADMLTEGNEIIRLEMVAVASAPTRWGRRTT